MDKDSFKLYRLSGELTETAHTSEGASWTWKRMELTENKRIRIDDRAKLSEIQDAIFKSRTHEDLEKVIRTYFGNKMIGMKQFKDLGIERGTAYFRMSARTLNNKIHVNVDHGDRKYVVFDDGIKYYEGEELTCKKSFKAKGVLGDATPQHIKFETNYTYLIAGVEEDGLVLVDVDQEVGLEGYWTCKVPADKIIAYFTLPYVNTVHSTQGDDLPTPYVIADWMCKGFVTKQWLYSAITRCVKLDDIYFLDRSLYDLNMLTEAAHMIANYRAQDRKAGRMIKDEDYPTPDVVVEMAKRCGMTCKYCGQGMSFERGDVRKITLNRKYNGEAHHTYINEVCCKLCNVSLK